MKGCALIVGGHSNFLIIKAFPARSQQRLRGMNGSFVDEIGTLVLTKGGLITHLAELYGMTGTLQTP